MCWFNAGVIGILAFVVKFLGLIAAILVAVWIALGALEKDNVADPLGGTLARRRLGKFAVARVIVYYAGIIGLTVVYGLRISAFDVPQYLLAKNMVAVVVALPFMLLCCVLMVVITVPARRGLAFRRLWTGYGSYSGPAATVLAMLGLTAFTMYVVADRAWEITTPVIGDLLSPVFALVYQLPLLIIAIVLPIAVILRMFNTAAVHPLLPALCAPWLVVAALIADRVLAYFYPEDLGGAINLSDGVQNLVSVVSVVVVCGLSAVEYWMTRTELRVTLRSGPLDLSPIR